VSNYRIEFTSSAARAIRKLPKNVRTRLLDAIEQLSDDPRPVGSRKLAGAELAWRIRAGDHRVIYEVEDDLLVVTVVRAAHRREVYR
jgi:mRNA interferase RelE/StbE